TLQKSRLLNSKYDRAVTEYSPGNKPRKNPGVRKYRCNGRQHRTAASVMAAEARGNTNRIGRASVTRSTPLNCKFSIGPVSQPPLNSDPSSPRNLYQTREALTTIKAAGGTDERITIVPISPPLATPSCHNASAMWGYTTAHGKN